MGAFKERYMDMINYRGLLLRAERSSEYQSILDQIEVEPGKNHSEYQFLKKTFETLIDQELYVSDDLRVNQLLQDFLKYKKEA
jgi:hypothetical protein